MWIANLNTRKWPDARIKFAWPNGLLCPPIVELEWSKQETFIRKTCLEQNPIMLDKYICYILFLTETASIQQKVEEYSIANLTYNARIFFFF